MQLVDEGGWESCATETLTLIESGSADAKADSPATARAAEHQPADIDNEAGLPPEMDSDGGEHAALQIAPAYQRLERLRARFWADKKR